MGEQGEVESVVEQISYNPQEVRHANFGYRELDKGKLTPGFNHWIKISGLNCLGMVRRLESEFGIHALFLEDLLNTQQKSKIEVQPDHIFLVTKILDFDPETKKLRESQFGLFIFQDFLITVEENSSSFFSKIRERIENGSSRIRRNSIAYLCYAVLDLIVDDYFVELEHIEDEIEQLEDEIITNPDQSRMLALSNVKRQLLVFKRDVWPLREVLSRLRRADLFALREQTDFYFSDLYEHLIQVIDIVENFRELVADLINIYLSTLSNRMNTVMKFLTLIATIFIPLTFIAGVYGMNFRYMPELNWRWGYPAAIFLMVLVVVVLVKYFRKRDWL
jgi:magnesium transporter